MKLSALVVIALFFVGIVVAFAGCTSTPAPAPTPVPTATVQTTAPLATGTTAPSGGQATVAIAAKNVLFNVTSITVPAGSTVTVYFDNQDSGVPHNFAVYTNQQATTKIFAGQIINGPGTTSYTFTAPSTPGSYWFRCDVHPTVMYGTLNVVANGPVSTAPNPAFS